MLDPMLITLLVLFALAILYKVGFIMREEINYSKRERVNNTMNAMFREMSVISMKKASNAKSTRDKNRRNANTRDTVKMLSASRGRRESNIYGVESRVLTKRSSSSSKRRRESNGEINTKSGIKRKSNGESG
jgi:hypothetical protein